MSLVRFLARSSAGLLAGAALGSVLSGVAGALLVALINRSLTAPRGALAELGLEFAAVGLASWLLRWLSHALFVRLGQATQARLRLHVSTSFAQAPYREIERQGAARLLAVMTEDIGAVAEFFVVLPRLIMQAAIVLGCFAYLAWLSLPAFGVAIGMVVLGSLRHTWAVRRASGHLGEARRAEDELYECFRALVAGAKELKLNRARRAAFAELLGTAVERVREQRARGLLIFVAAGSWGAFLFFAVIGAVIFGLGSAFEVPGPVRAGYALMFLYMMYPMEGLLEAIPEISRTRVAIERIEAVGATLTRAARPPRAPATIDRLVLTNVSHAYRRDSEDGAFELGPIDLVLRGGEVLFLIGGNGSGKTTLAKLVAGLYEPERGQIELDGRPVDAATRDAYRQHFAAVFSDFHLFDELLGLTDPALEPRARQLLVELELAHKVRIERGKFSTTELSRGQQKRLALLVACLEDRPIYVFDEWAADQDPAYKEVFYTRVLPELKARGKALLVVTHDDRYFHLADRAVRLVAGRITAIAPERLVASPMAVMPA
jgi:putative pyoverdin transport system ATP-binding/permease protein